VQAKVLVAHVPCVIGMSDAIGDEAAIVYAGSFYRALASGLSVANAHEQGIVSLGLPPSGGQTRHVKPAGVVPCAATPRLLTRSDVDANCIYLVREPGKHVVIVIEATLSDFNEDMLARITQELRRWTDDLSLRITKVEKGSVRLTIALVPAAARTLMELRRNGRLSGICGFEISAMFELQAPEMAAQAAVDDARMVAVGRQGHAVVRRVVGGTELPDRTEVDSRHQALDLESVLMDAEPALRRLAKRLCGDNVDAHDLLQDTFEWALRQGMPPGISKLAWLARIMHHLFIDRYRVAARRPNHEALEDIHRNFAELEFEELDFSKITVDDIRDALGAIEPVYREVYVLHTFEHLSYEQIAERLSIQRITVRTRLARARKKLRAVLAKRFGLGDES
jgi:RNA polymerase sigma-70 factor (ECF subfamily)